MTYLRSYTINYNTTQSIFIALLCMINILYFTPIIGYSDIYKILSKIILFPSIILYLYRLVAYKKTDLSYYKIVLIILMISIVIIFMVKFNFLLFLGYITFIWPMFLIIVMQKEVLTKALNYFRIFFAISLIPSLLLYPLIASGNTTFLIGTIQPLHELKEAFGWYYNNYGFSYVLVDSLKNIHLGNSAGLFRMSGLFDEPGVIGTLAALLLTATKYKLDKVNILLIIAGILSFSLAFYLISLIYILLASKPSQIVKVVTPIVILFFLFASNPFIQNNIFDRLSFEDGKMTGDNRTTEEFEIAFIAFTLTPAVWMGSPKSAYELGIGSASWKNLIWDYGIIGTAMMFLFFALYTYSNIRDKIYVYIPFILIFLLNIYQRPHVFDITYFFIFAAGIAYQTQQNQERNTLQKSKKARKFALKWK